MDAAQIFRAVAPEAHLRERARILRVLAVILPIDDLLDLARPVDERRLEALHEVLLLGRGLDADDLQILRRDVQDRLVALVPSGLRE